MNWKCFFGLHKFNKNNVVQAYEGRYFLRTMLIYECEECEGLGKKIIPGRWSLEEYRKEFVNVVGRALTSTSTDGDVIEIDLEAA